MTRICENCGNPFDPIMDYENVLYDYDYDFNDVDLSEIWPDISDRTLCVPCALSYAAENMDAGCAYFWSLETGRDPAEYHAS